MEREELAKLFERYGTDVFRLAFSYLGSRPDGSQNQKKHCKNYRKAFTEALHAARLLCPSDDIVSYYVLTEELYTIRPTLPSS